MTRKYVKKKDLSSTYKILQHLDYFLKIFFLKSFDADKTATITDKFLKQVYKELNYLRHFHAISFTRFINLQN